jgi:DnaJ-class molecular chaperone
MKTVIEKTHYDVLGVPPGALVSDLRAAYLALALKHHPDTGSASNAALFADVTEAYAVLKDPDRRRAYDATLALLTAACPECEGSGVVYQMRNFTHREESPCRSCAGRGRA